MSDPKIERIRAAYERDMREQPKARKAGDIPISYEAITPEWMTALLCKDTPGAEVTEIRLGEPDSGTSNRRRIFLSYNAAGQAAGLPKSVFCKAAHALSNRLLLSSAATLSETIFFNKARAMLDIDAPEAYLADYDPESWASIVVMKDIGDEVEFCSHETPMDQASVRSQLDLLARLHGKFFESPLFDSELSDVPTFQFRFRNLVNKHGLQKCCEDGVDASEAITPARLFARRAEIWPATVRAVDRFDVLPVTYTHNDVHLKNWYIRDRPKMGLGDWQVVCRGHWSRDVAYTISTALTPENRRAWERDLVKFYLDRLHAEGGPKLPFDEAWLDYREQMLTALAWWTMTLTPSPEMPDMQPQDTTIEFIRRIIIAVDDLESLDVAR
ncbi:MAG: phosphotransferase [Caulobacterales bacterium]